ncbi:CvpA family membrane protein [Campylobacter blaseri]|uniref:Colicin V production CvpA n=1 Tax=Campylobacter blaseri TaxID=2042961 RepID=A0A2P8R1F0_9BACT|nr:CvpA family protein [Campylobacter blaseri]PSM52314.1 colicin V production CvpA [Campylobacter blaseri]PSM54080.1 colicin V production CvpA [Campylobacter blaseri]QKF85522.1 CvpA family membrane protein [Campylobacter blaseri]
MSGANWIDIIIIVLILIFALKGLKSGIVREIFGIIGIIGGFIVAMKCKAEVGAWISRNIYDLNQINIMSGNGMEVIVGFIATIFGIWIASLILGEIISKLFEVSGLGFIDRLGGFVFGGTKIFLVFALLASFIHSSIFLNSQVKPFFEKSIAYPNLVKAGDYLLNLKKEDIKIEISTKPENNEANIVYETSDYDEPNTSKVNKE